jgi:predicted 2-oxoglutarate/Fe(II)-dependent dioxygenase YbiX
MLNLKNIPCLISYILYFSSFLLNQIYDDYEIKNTVNFYYDEIFICKYKGESTYNPDVDKIKFYDKRVLNTDNSIISINIQLNEIEQYIGNNLCILDENCDETEVIMNDEDDGIQIQKGDAIVYNGRKKRTSGSVIAGSKYVLVIFMKLKI